MTSRDKDWIDDILEDEEASMWQIGKIEGLMLTSSSGYLYNSVELTELTYNEAEKIIKDLYENNNPTDPKDQFRRMYRAGVFNETPKSKKNT